MEAFIWMAPAAIARGLPLVFVLLFNRLSGRVVLGVGLLYGLAVWAFMIWGVLIWADQTMYDRVQLAGGLFFLDHLLYGVLVGLAPGIARRHYCRSLDGTMTTSLGADKSLGLTVG